MKQNRKLSGLVVITTLMLAILVGCQTSNEAAIEYKYYSQSQLRDSLENGSAVVILDVQVEEEFDAHHIEGAIPTYAFPVKSDDDKAKIDAQFHLIDETDSTIVIVCARGQVGAERTYEYLLDKGVAQERLFILEGGQAGWISASDDVNDTETSDETNEGESLNEINDVESSNDT